jgi:hypothetical protein
LLESQRELAIRREKTSSRSPKICPLNHGSNGGSGGIRTERRAKRDKSREGSDANDEKDGQFPAHYTPHKE